MTKELVIDSNNYHIASTLNAIRNWTFTPAIRERPGGRSQAAADVRVQREKHVQGQPHATGGPHEFQVRSEHLVRIQG